MRSLGIEYELSPIERHRPPGLSSESLTEVEEEEPTVVMVAEGGEGERGGIGGDGSSNNNNYEMTFDLDLHDLNEHGPVDT